MESPEQVADSPAMQDMEDWLADTLQDSVDMDWSTTDGAKAIVRHWAESPVAAEVARLQALVAQYEEGLERIRDYNWPELAGHHKQTFYGEATGNEYTLKHPIPRETASQALGSLKEIARTTLTAKGADHA